MLFKEQSFVFTCQQVRAIADLGNFNRHFYRYTPPRLLAEIDAEIKAAEAKILRLLREVTT